MSEGGGERWLMGGRGGERWSSEEDNNKMSSNLMPSSDPSSLSGT